LDTPHSVGLLWASDQPKAETSKITYSSSLLIDKNKTSRLMLYNQPVKRIGKYILRTSGGIVVGHARVIKSISWFTKSLKRIIQQPN
jgi:hypothetical protein